MGTRTNCSTQNPRWSMPHWSTCLMTWSSSLQRGSVCRRPCTFDRMRMHFLLLMWLYSDYFFCLSLGQNTMDYVYQCLTFCLYLLSVTGQQLETTQYFQSLCVFASA